MKTENHATKLLALTAVLWSAVACADLSVVNQNDPDRERAISSASDVEALISGAFRPWYWTAHDLYPGPAMSVAADAHSSSWGNFGMRDASWEPRKAYDNDPAYTYDEVNRIPWEYSYRSLAAVRDGLLAIEGGTRIDQGATDNTDRAIAFGKFIQALSLANLAVTFDRSFVVDETVEDVLSLSLQDYNQVWAAAENKFGEVIQIGSSGSWSIPSAWVGFNGDWSAGYLTEIARAYRARYRTQVPRTPSERDAVDWAAVLRDAEAGISEDYAGNRRSSADWTRHASKLWAGVNPGWARMDYRTIGPADASGQWETWINDSHDDKRPFDIDTDDRRITGGAPNEDGLYIRYLGNSPFRANRGIYHFSNYIDDRWYHLIQNSLVGVYPDMTAKELEFLVAEANYRLGNMAATMATVNKYRTENGQLPPFTSVDEQAPGGDRCVPQLADGSCGTLWHAYKYEKRIELFHYGFGTEYFDDRGWGDLVTNTWTQLPIPGSELDILLMEIYSFGGPGGESAAPDVADDISPRALRYKRAAWEAWAETRQREFGDVGHNR